MYVESDELKNEVRLLSEEQLRREFEAADLDGSGGVDVVELQKHLRKLGIGAAKLKSKGFGAIMQRFDTSRDGELQFDEFVKFAKAYGLTTRAYENENGILLSREKIGEAWGW